MEKINFTPVASLSQAVVVLNTAQAFVAAPMHAAQSNESSLRVTP
jgi:hypothetical protein